MKIFQSMNISATGLTAERMRLDIIANNLANVNTTRTPQGGPFKKQVPVFTQKLQKIMQGPGGISVRGGGVEVSKILEDKTPPRMAYNPDHPDANGEGYVAMPNINIVNEMVDMITATRSYEANVTALNATKSIYLKALEIGR